NSWSFTGTANYNNVPATTITDTITPRSASVSTSNSGKFYGTPDPNPLTTATLTNFISSDGVTASFTRVSGGAVGTYHITTVLSPLSALGNYSISNPGATFTINPDTTSLTYTGPTSSMYGQCGTINLSAVLMDINHNV